MPVYFKDLPGPRGLPLIGNFHQIPLHRRHACFEKWAVEFGPVYKVRLGPVPIGVISAPSLIHQILKARPALFRRMARLDRIFQQEGVHGVFNAEGEDWKTHRRIITRGLDLKHQKRFFPLLSRIAERLLHKMNVSASNHESYAIQEDLLRFTVDVTTSLAFGIDMNTLEQKGGVIQDHLEKVFPMIFRRINRPFQLHKVLATKQDKAFDLAMSAIERQVHDFLEEGKNRLASNPALRDQPENILEALIQAASEESTITEREIRGNLMTLLLAGEDTTAHSLAWAVYLICRNTEVQQKLQQEADEVLGHSPYLIQYEDHESMRYTAAVIQETLRLKAVAPVLLLEPLADTTIDGYFFRKGTKLALLIRASGLREGYFSNASTFQPDRWLEEKRGKCPVHMLEAYLPFGSGPRLCPGKNLAILEMKLVLSMIARHFTMELVHPEHEIMERMAFTMMPEPFSVRLKRRTESE